VNPRAGTAPLLAGLGCYLLWGFNPLVFQAIGRQGVGPWETLAHRVVWSVPTALVFVLLAGQWGSVRRVLHQPRTLAWLALSSALVTANWAIFISAVNTSRVLETSLGYYLNPLVNIAAGALLFHEWLDRPTRISIGLAAVGVALQAVALGRIPWTSLFLAVSFGGYGVVRKLVSAEAQTGLFVETLLLGLPALGGLLWLHGAGEGHFGAAPLVTAWLVASGPITAVPLVLFAWAARRIPLSAMGFLQFLLPTISFAIGLAQGEAFTPLRALSFVFIWGGVAVFAAGAFFRSRSGG
jgi:chloramphenicol-sensitive protein RarD